MVGRWRAWPVSQRAFSGLLLLAAIAAAAFAFFLQRDTSTALFAQPLYPEQLSEVVDRLAAWNVPFVTTSDNVRIAARRKNDVLLRMALDGIPHPHLSSSAGVLQQANPLTPQSVLDAQERDGLEGDLAASLRGIAGVRDARVIVAPAVPSTFADEAAQPTTASVRLSLTPGSSLTPAQVDGITTFVASAVPGLVSKRIAVLDDRGSALANAVAEGRGNAVSSEAGSMQESLQSALDGALGSGSAIVRVHVSRDARARESRDVVRRPLGVSIGSATDAQTYRIGDKQYANRNAVIAGGSEWQDREVQTPSGEIDRVSVAVAVDAARRLDVGKIRALASATLGLLPNRGDVVSVEALTFPHARRRKIPWVPAIFGTIGTLGPSALLALGIAFVARCGTKPAAALTNVVAERFAAARSRKVQGLPAVQVRGVLAGEPPHTAAAIISALPAATATAVLELYPADERAAIVRRMSRACAPAVPRYEDVVRRG